LNLLGVFRAASRHYFNHYIGASINYKERNHRSLQTKEKTVNIAGAEAEILKSELS